jgi:branched-chain amino acid transport system substrate-binding protein
MRINNTRMLIALLVVFALILAACGDGGDTTTTTAAAGDDTPDTAAPETTVAAPETTVAAPDTTEAMEEFVPGPLGAVTLAPGEDIQIRSLQAISGDVATLGIPNQRGAELAIEDFGPIAGHNVSLGTPLDDLCSSDGGQSAAQTIVSDDRVVGVIGTSCSGAAAGAIPLISEAGMVMISPSNTSPSLTSDLAGNANENYYPGYYRTAHNDLFQGAAVAEFAINDLGVTNAAAIHDGDPYTNGLAQAFANAFEALGGTVSVFTAVNKGDTDMTPVLTEVAAGSPEMIFFPIFMPEGGFIAQQVSGVSGLEDVILVAADGMLADNFLELPESEGVYMSGPDLRYGVNQSEIGTTADDFLAAYDAAYGEAPSAVFWAHSYDATVLLLTAISEVAVEGDDGTLYIDRQALREALTATSNFGGIIGTINCDDFGDCGAQRITVVQALDSSDVASSYANVVFEYAPSN